MPSAQLRIGDEEIGYLGRSVTRVEDAALLTGRGRFADDVGVRPGTLHAAILRSPYPHGMIRRIDCTATLATAGVHCVLTGDDVRKWAAPFVVGVKQPMEHWCLAVDKVRYAGEPVAVVVAESRYAAEDGLDTLEVEIEPLPAVVDTLEAMTVDAPILHEKVGSNVVSDRKFSYGDPEEAFAEAPHRISTAIRYPRNSGTPMECSVVIAEYHPSDGSYDVLSNFMGPFALHSVMAMALKVPGARLRLRMPRDSGGSFGVKQSAFPYIVLMALAARKAGAPVKWVEDRMEHLVAATSATNRVSTLSAAVTADGRILALDYDQIDDCGAYLRAPEPATFYRMHGCLTGAYDIRHLKVRNRVVLTNKTPAGLVRGFGGPQVYFALERLMQRIAVELRLDPLEVIRRNLIPARAFPYRAVAGALLDSGNFQDAIARGIEQGKLQELFARRDAIRSAGGLYGIGLACIVEPSISNMGYISTVLTLSERAKAGPKNGGIASATVAVDALGSVSAMLDSLPQGQGHLTVAAQIVADVLGLKPEDITVNAELDTQKDAWSIAAGNYSSRFAGATAGTLYLAACKIRDKIAAIAGHLLNVPADQLLFRVGKVLSRDDGNLALPLHRIAGTAHWSPALLPSGMTPGMRETVFWSPESLAAPDEGDHINTSAAYGFVFDYCGVQIDRGTGKVQIDRYVTTHDAGPLLHPAMVDGQIRGGFAQAVGASLYEEFRYGEDGGFLSGSFADYLVPTSNEVPDPVIVHCTTPSPFTPLGAKGVGEGNSMSTPVCIANAVADALGVDQIGLPITPSKIIEFLSHVGAREPAPQAT